MIKAEDIAWAALVGLALGAFTALCFLSGCTPAQQQTAMSATYTGTRIAACVESVLAEEEQARALAHRLAETARELEAEEIREAAREHSDTTAEQVEQVLR